MKVNITNQASTFFLLLIFLQFSKGILYPIDTILSSIISLLLVIISIFYLIKSTIIKQKNNYFFFSWLLLVLLNFSGYIYTVIIKGNSNPIYFSQISNILLITLPFFPLYYFSYKGNITERKIKYFFLGSLIITIIDYYFTKSSIIADTNLDVDNIVNNSSYLFVALLPYVFFWDKNKLVAFPLLVLLIFFIIKSSKRGAIICAVAMTLIFITFQLRDRNPKKILLSILGILGLLGYSYNIYKENPFLMDRLQISVTNLDKASSGRDIIYTNLLNHWLQSDNIIYKIFGFGFVSTIEYSGSNRLAHNDWLELLINFGLLGISIYIISYFSILISTHDKKMPKRYRVMIFSVSIIWILKTMFSMFYTSISSLYLVILLGYYLGTNTYIRKKGMGLI